MQVLLSDACQQHPKPTLALVGATIQGGLADTAASMVSLRLPLLSSPYAGIAAVADFRPSAMAQPQ